MFRIKSPQDVGAAVVFVGLGLAGVPHKTGGVGAAMAYLSKGV